MIRHLFAFPLLAILAGAAMAADAPAPAARPNVIFVLIDDLGWRDVGFTGSKFYETPNIDKLAAGGFRFDQGYAACAVCSPTRASILTGKYPARLHITDYIPGEGNWAKGKLKIPEWQKFLPLSETTLGDEFRRAGYATASIGKWHLGGPEYAPTHHGFDLNVGGGAPGHPPSYFAPYRLPEIGDAQDGEYLTDRLTLEAQKFIEAQHRAGKPFFLYLPHYAVHMPLQAKPNLLEKYKKKTPDGGQKNAVYAAMIESVDDGMGALLGTLDKLGIRQNTIVIFTSDNGGVTHAPVTSNAPLRSGKGSPYEGGTREATVISWPGHIAPGSTAVPMLSMDFFPTLLELAGLKLDHAVDGVSVAPLLDGHPAADSPIMKRDAIFWHYPHYWNGGKVRPFSSIRQGDWKLIEFHEDHRAELYNLKEDIGEANNLAASQPAKAESLRARLHEWLKDVGAQMPTPK